MTKVKPGHRKTVKHFDVPGHVHELTFSCLDRRPLLADDRFRVLLADGVSAACERHSFLLLAYVFMPEHVHLLVVPTKKEYRIADLLFAMKRPVSFRIKRTLEESAESHDRDLLGSLIVRERPGHNSFRFWQEGPGYDRNLFERDAMVNSAKYLHDNPVKRGLVKKPGEWVWSSWRNYHDADRAGHTPIVNTSVLRTGRMPHPESHEEKRE